MSNVAFMRSALIAEGHAITCPVVQGVADTCDCRTGARIDKLIAVHSSDIGIVERLTSKLHYHRLIHTCLTCIFFDESSELCRPIQLRPPAKTIAYGCPEWRDDSEELTAWAMERMARVGGTLDENLEVVVTQQFTGGLDKIPF